MYTQPANPENVQETKPSSAPESSPRPPDWLPHPIANEDLPLLPLASFQGPIQFLDRTEEALAIVPELLAEEVLGFDTETRPAFEPGKSYPTALIQIATAHRVILVCLLKEKGVLEALSPVIASRQPIKTGVGIADDMKELMSLHRMSVDGVVDLSAIARKHHFPRPGLRGLAAAFLGVRISKSAQRSNWAQRPLTERQVRYAATDAWISRELFLAMKSFEAVK